MFEDPATLRRRRSSKWAEHPPDVLRRLRAAALRSRRGFARLNIGTSAALLDDAEDRMAEAVTASGG